MWLEQLYAKIFSTLNVHPNNLSILEDLRWKILKLSQYEDYYILECDAI
jgi:hypothetical protein